MLLAFTHPPSRTVRRRDHVYGVVTRALAARFPAEDLDGLTPPTRAAFEAARGEALWRDGVLIGLTDGYRDASMQAELLASAVRRTGSVRLALQRILPPDQSRHVRGTALDVRPAEGARWLDRYGARHYMYRIYDNEWWHFEYRPEGRPPRLPRPGASPASEVCLVHGGQPSSRA